MLDLEHCGHAVPIQDRLKTNEIDLDYLRLPNQKCIVVKDDIKLMSGKVLHKNCIYGAPVYLTEFSYRKNQKAPENPLAELIDAVVLEEESGRIIDSRHKLVVNCLLPSLLPFASIRHP